jgi:hypothetical protein
MSELSGFEPGMGVWRMWANKGAVEFRAGYDMSYIRFTIDPADLARFLRENFPEVME